MRARSRAGEFNGSVLVARQGRILYQRGFGLANMEWNIPNEVNTKFEIASMSEAIHRAAHSAVRQRRQNQT